MLLLCEASEGRLAEMMDSLNRQRSSGSDHSASSSASVSQDVCLLAVPWLSPPSPPILWRVFGRPGRAAGSSSCALAPCAAAAAVVVVALRRCIARREKTGWPTIREKLPPSLDPRHVSRRRPAVTALLTPIRPSLVD